MKRSRNAGPPTSPRTSKNNGPCSIMCASPSMTGWSSCAWIDAERVGLTDDKRARSISSPLFVLMRDRVNECRLPALHRFDPALERGRNVLRLLDRALGIPAKRTGNVCKIGRRFDHVHPDVGPLDRRPALTGNRDLVLPVVVVRAVVMHDDEHRDLVVCRRPQRAQVEH